MHKWKTAAIKIIELDSDLEKYPLCIVQENGKVTAKKMKNLIPIHLKTKTKL